MAAESNNLVLAARDAFAAAFGALPPLAITLDKRLPVASGIGGGSADAAAILRVLGRVRGVAVEDMAEIALTLGLDAVYYTHFLLLFFCVCLVVCVWLLSFFCW